MGDRVQRVDSGGGRRPSRDADPALVSSRAADRSHCTDGLLLGRGRSLVHRGLGGAVEPVEERVRVPPGRYYDYPP